MTILLLITILLKADSLFPKQQLYDQFRTGSNWLSVLIMTSLILITKFIARGDYFDIR